MSSENTVIKSVLLSLFDKGKTEVEAYEELSKIHNQHSATLSTVKKWYKEFNSEERTLDIKKKRGRDPKFTDEFLIGLIKENPGLNMTRLAKLANASVTTISNRLKKIGADEENLCHIANIDNRRTKKFTDEYLINLINENPSLNLVEIAKIANTSAQNISFRIRRINESSERLKYVKKDASKFTDEFLINLIDKNPELNMEELAKLAGASIVTISNRIKHISHDGQKINYSKKGAQNGTTKFTDEYLINLVKENPGLNSYGLAKLAGTSQPTISNRLRKINNNRPNGDKITLPKHKFKSNINLPYMTDEYLIKLVEDNPNLNIAELAKLENTSFYYIWKRIKQINSNGQKINYVTNRLKFSDEYLIQLINDNPESNMKELAKLAGTSPATIINRIKQINNDKQIECYHKKISIRRSKAFTDEFLINLINENPGYNMEKLAKLANVSASTISKRLKEINKNGERVVYINKLRK